MLVLGLVAPQAALAELSDESMIGPGLRLRPAYDGSASRNAELVPVIRYLGQPWFVRSTQGLLEGGGRMELAPGLHAGAQLAYEPGRKTNDSDFLRNRNVADVDPGASYGFQLEWDGRIGRAPFTLLARTRQHTDSDRGAQADLRFSVGVLQSGAFSAGVYTQATWANAKSTSSLYGITPQQATVTGLPAFSAGSGLLHASLGFLWSYTLGEKWLAVGNFEARRLHGDAAHSPLTERASGYSATAGVAYRF